MPEIISSMTEWIPFLQNYPTPVKVLAILTGFCLLLTVGAALILGPIKQADPVQTDAAKLAPPEANGSESNPKPYQSSKKTITPLEQMAQSNETGKNEINVNKGTNSGIIGGSNNTINNITNLGIQPRALDVNELNAFIAQYPDTNIRIGFRAYNGTDAEMNNFKQQITNALRQRGYNNIDDQWFMTHGGVEPRFVNIVPIDGGGVMFQVPHQ